MERNQPRIDDYKLATEVTLTAITKLRDSDKCVTITLNTHWYDNLKEFHLYYSLDSGN